jgi:hypothetical protein
MSTSGARALAAVSELAASQWGLLTTAQAERQSITRLHLARLTDAGVLERVDRGVYATASSPADHRALRAAWLTLDPARTAEERLADLASTGVASHTSAAALHHLGDLLDDTPELTLPHRKQSRRGIRLHRMPLTESDITIVDGLPATTQERTVADLLRDGHDPDHVAQIIGQGVRRGVIDLPSLTAHLEPLARRHGQPSGPALVEHFLDLVGLSPAALARELASSPAGQELVAVGRSAAFADLMASLVPQINTAERLGLDKISSDLIASKFDVTQSVAFRDAIAMATSPAAQSAQRWLTPDAGRRAARGARAATAAAHETEEWLVWKPTP